MQSISDIIAQDSFKDWKVSRDDRDLKRPQRRTLDELDLAHHNQLRLAVSKARQWHQMRKQIPGLSLLMSGDFGTGKTHIAQAILWTYLMSPEETGTEFDVPAGRFYHASDFLIQLSPDTSGNVIENIPITQFIGVEPLVVLDDVGANITLPFVAKEMQDAERQNRYFRFFDYCADKGHPISVVITTNLSIHGGRESLFANHIGYRSWDRLQAMCKSFFVDMSAIPSYREVLATQ